jgi:sterol desaturase/sphingolipid hydroxylase (fatty acid hydroxylase superfamily)
VASAPASTSKHRDVGARRKDDFRILAGCLAASDPRRDYTVARPTVPDRIRPVAAATAVPIAQSDPRARSYRLDWPGAAVSNLLIYSIPAFIALLLLEKAWARHHRSDLSIKGYETRDTLASLAMGLGNVGINAITKLGAVALWAWAYQYRVFDLGHADIWWSWVVLFFAEDICYYWFHRSHHEVRFLWAAHVNHHSSQFFNLSTALRQPWFTPLTGPAHHRVHHGKNVPYLDKNHAGVLIVWDRLFGTFAPEREPVRYGLTTDIETFNPGVIAVHEYVAIARDVRRAGSWRDAAGYVLRPPGWSPDGSSLTATQLQRGMTPRVPEA